MRTFVANCMMIALTIALVGAPSVLNPVLAQRPRAGSIAASSPEQSFVQGVQFEEVVPGPAAEVDIATEISNAIGEVVSDSGSTMPEMMPEAMAPVEAVPMMESVPMDSVPMGVPAVESALSGEIVYDTAFEGGQPYDIPVSDVIPQDSAEVYSTNNWFRGGQWYSKQELVMLLRSDLSPIHLAVDNTSVAGALLSGAAAVVLDPFLSHSLSSEDGGVTYEAGTRLSLGRIMGRDVANRDHSIEFTFFGLFDHTGRASIEPTNLIVAAGIDTLLGSREIGATTSQTGQVSGFPFIHEVAGFSDSARQEMLFTSSLNSFEMNYMVGGRPARDRMVMQPDGRWSRFATPSKIRGFYFGLRYVRQNEMFRYQGFGNRQTVSQFAEDELGEIVFQDGDGDPTTDDPVPTVTGNRIGTIDERGTYRVNTDNDLFGFQIGGDVVAKRTDWAFGMNGKVGGLINFADRNSSLVQRTEVVADRPVTNNPEEDAVFATTSVAETLDDETLTFLSELNIYMAYYLRPNTSVKVGYNILYMNGMAAALDNSGLEGGIFPKFELTGDAFYHGMNVGFETSW